LLWWFVCGGGALIVSIGNVQESPTSPTPMTAASVLKNHADTLSDFEQSEILEYSHIYFTGGSATKIRASAHAGTTNHGALNKNDSSKLL